MLFFNIATSKIEYLDEQTGVISPLIPKGGYPSTSKEVTPDDAIFRVLLTLSSTLFSSMIMWMASPKDKENLCNETWEEAIEKVEKMMNEDEEISKMGMGDLLIGLIGWIEKVIIMTWGKTRTNIMSSAIEIIEGAPKRVVDLILLEMATLHNKEGVDE